MTKEEIDTKFGDIWLRARHNALANLEAANDAKYKTRIYEVITSVLIILPIVSVTLSKVCLFFSNWDLLFSLVGSVGALFLTLVGFVQESKTNMNYYTRAHSTFNNIAQKARRGSNPYIEEEEKKYLIRALEEMFETAKANSLEPSDAQYNRGFERIKNMPRLPFGLNLDD